jgi:polyisoprenoid-binding protein YceI
MKKTFIIALAGIATLLVSFKADLPATWTLDKMHARVGFSITHNMTSDVEGTFRSIDATINTSREDFTEAVFNFTADAASITTDNEHRDKNIRNADFLDVEKYPKITFKSTAVTKKTASTYQIKGDLTLHGITKTIVLVALVRVPPAELRLKKTVAGFKISGVIKRADFNLGSGFANMMLGDEITLTANGEFARN